MYSICVYVSLPLSFWLLCVFVILFCFHLFTEQKLSAVHDDGVHYLAENKRKGDDGLENPTAKTKRVEKRKCSDLIVLGLPWKSSEEDIKKYFEQFGEVIMVQVLREIFKPVHESSSEVEFIVV